MERTDADDDQELQEVYVGKRCKVIHCVGARESYYSEMAAKSQQKSKIRSMANRLSYLIERLANGEPMSFENFPPEEKLPDGTKFHAFKKIPMRAYVWKSARRKNEYYISHYRMKLEDDLDPKDTKIVIRNWTRIEVDNEER